jgi:hypothetical protein
MVTYCLFSTTVSKGGLTLVPWTDVTINPILFVDTPAQGAKVNTAFWTSVSAFRWDGHQFNNVIKYNLISN